MSDASKTIESSIIEGMAKRPHLTGLNIANADILVPDLMTAIFHPSVRWAVQVYLKELEEADDE